MSRSVPAAFLLLAASLAWGSYFEQYYRNLGDLAFLAMIHDNGGMPGGMPIQEQRKHLEETVIREQANWKAQTQRFVRGRHDFMRTASLATIPFREKHPNRICVYLPMAVGEICYTSRVPVATSGLFALRFAVAFRRIADGPPTGGSFHAALSSQFPLPLQALEQFTYDVPAAELEVELERARVDQFRRADRSSVPFMLLLGAKQYDRALDEAVATYEGFRQKKGDALIKVDTPKALEINRPMVAASSLTQHVRALLTTVPDSAVVGMATRVQLLLARLDPQYLDGIGNDVKLMYTEMQAAGLR